MTSFEKTFFGILAFLLVSLSASWAAADWYDQCDPDFERCSEHKDPRYSDRCDPDFEYCPPSSRSDRGRRCNPHFEYCPPPRDRDRQRHCDPDFEYCEKQSNSRARERELKRKAMSLDVLSRREVRRLRPSDYDHRFHSCESRQTRALVKGAERAVRLCQAQGGWNHSRSARSQFDRESYRDQCVEIFVQCARQSRWSRD